MCAACNGTGTIRHCQDSGADGHDFRSKRCHRCALNHTLHELRADGDPDAVAKLEPLLRRVEQHRRSRSALTWLQRSSAAPTFHAMLRGEIPISRQGLDERDAGQATAYLRSWLVADGVLEVREERLARFERWAQTTVIDEIADGHDAGADHDPEVLRGELAAVRREYNTVQFMPGSATSARAARCPAARLSQWRHGSATTDRPRSLCPLGSVRPRSIVRGKTAGAPRHQIPEIAAERFLSIKAVESHLRNIFHNTPTLARWLTPGFVVPAGIAPRRSTGAPRTMGAGALIPVFATQCWRMVGGDWAQTATFVG